MRPGHYEITQSVSLYDARGDKIEGLSTETKIVRTNDAYKKIIGDGNARVSVGLDESIGGPYGYSSVKLRFNVTMSCDQNEEALEKAAELGFQDAVKFLDDHIDSAHKLLTSHLERVYTREG
jgi:hypothetical protein